MKNIYDEKIIKYVNNFLKKDFPFPSFTKNHLCKDLNNLKTVETNKLIFKNTGLDIVKHYHHSIFLANKDKYISPFEAWFDKKCLIKAVENRLKYKKEPLKETDILNSFSIAQIAPKVSVFKPFIAKYIINKYAKEYNTIFDPCSGYSGRLLGANALNKNYIGQDINENVVEESNKLIKELNIYNVSVKCKNSLATTGEYDCLFTCPPYGEKENWNQSIEILSADEWIDVCLNNYKCNRYIFVVDETKKYKEYIKEEITSKSHFTRNTEYIIVIDAKK